VGDCEEDELRGEGVPVEADDGEDEADGVKGEYGWPEGRELYEGLPLWGEDKEGWEGVEEEDCGVNYGNEEGIYG